MLLMTILYETISHYKHQLISQDVINFIQNRLVSLLCAGQVQKERPIRVFSS